MTKEKFSVSWHHSYIHCPLRSVWKLSEWEINRSSRRVFFHHYSITLWFDSQGELQDDNKRLTEKCLSHFPSSRLTFANCSSCLPISVWQDIIILMSNFMLWMTAIYCNSTLSPFFLAFYIRVRKHFTAATLPLPWEMENTAVGLRGM